MYMYVDVCIRNTALRITLAAFLKQTERYRFHGTRDSSVRPPLLSVLVRMTKQRGEKGVTVVRGAGWWRDGTDEVAS